MITLTTLHAATPQQVFDQVVAHLREQNAQAVMERGTETVCQYRTPDGLKCAVGCLISDDEYHPRMEGEGSTVVLVDWEREHPKDPPIDDVVVRLLDQLQRVHDRGTTSTWEQAFAIIAEQYTLTYTPPEVTP
jgi:hypothetical protein